MQLVEITWTGHQPLTTPLYSRMPKGSGRGRNKSLLSGEQRDVAISLLLLLHCPIIRCRWGGNQALLF